MAPSAGARARILPLHVPDARRASEPCGMDVDGSGNYTASTQSVSNINRGTRSRFLPQLENIVTVRHSITGWPTFQLKFESREYMNCRGWLGHAIRAADEFPGSTSGQLLSLLIALAISHLSCG